MDESSTVQEPDLQIIISSGTANVHQVVLGFSAALAAAQMGTQVTVVFSMLGAHWASDTVGHDNHRKLLPRPTRHGWQTHPARTNH